MKLRQLVAAIAAVVVSVPLGPRNIPDYPGLFFKDGKFEITMFNDLHLGDRGNQDGVLRTVEDDDRTIQVMNEVLNHENHTNLAVINGDLMSGEWTNDDGSHPLLDKMMSPFLQRKLHFATTFGNHEWQPTLNTKLMTQYIWNKANQYTPGITFTTSSVDGDPNLVGTSNYYIPIYSTANGKQVLKMILWLFDSKGGFAYTGDPNNKQGVKGYVHDEVVDWFKRTRNELEQEHGGKTIPSLVFFHVPIPVTEKRSNTHFSKRMPGIGEEYIGTQDLDQPSQLMQALIDTKGLLGVFTGHCHRTDWCMKWNKAFDSTGVSWPSEEHYINLCFGRHTGYGGYSEFMRGGRHIVIHEKALEQNKIDNAIETWNRLEDGSVSGWVMLNSTYGKDLYPPVQLLYSEGRGSPKKVAARNDDKGKGPKTSKSHSMSTKVHSKSKATSTPSSKVSRKTSEPTSTTLGSKSSTPTKTMTTYKATRHHSHQFYPL